MPSSVNHQVFRVGAVDQRPPGGVVDRLLELERVQNFAVAVANGNGLLVGGGNGLAVGTPGDADAVHFPHFLSFFDVEDRSSVGNVASGYPGDPLAVGREGDAAVAKGNA